MDPERRIAADGSSHTRAEFAEWYRGEAAERAWEHARIATEPARVASSHVTERTRTPEQARSGLATEQAVTAPAGTERRFAGDGTPASDTAGQADSDLPQEQATSATEAATHASETYVALPAVAARSTASNCGACQAATSDAPAGFATEHALAFFIL